MSGPSPATEAQPHAPPAMRAIVAAWLPAALWAGLIWHLGGDAWSASETSGMLRALLDWIAPDLEFATRVRVMTCLRKLAHPGVYGVLAALSFPAASFTLRASAGLSRLLLCLMPLAALAVADEWRQSASPVRTGASFDVLLDVAGGVVVVGVAIGLERLAGRRLFGPGPTE